MRNGPRYLKITAWAEARYSRRNAKGERVILMTAPGPVPSRYRRIEDLAAVAYLGSAERFPGLCLRNCPTFA